MNAFSLDNRINKIRRNRPQDLRCPAGPLDSYFVHHFRGAQAEVEPEIVLGEIAGTSAHLVELDQLSRLHSNPRSDCQAIALPPLQPEQNPVIFPVAVVEQ